MAFSSSNLRTYGNKNSNRSTAVEVFDNLLAQNLDKRKLRGRKKRTYKLKELPPLDSYHPLMEDSFELPKKNDRFDELFKLPNYNKVSTTVGFINNNSSITDHSSGVENDKSSISNNLILPKRRRSKRICTSTGCLHTSSTPPKTDSSSQRKSLSKMEESVNNSLFIERVQTKYRLPEYTTISSLSSMSISKEEMSKRNETVEGEIIMTNNFLHSCFFGAKNSNVICSTPIKVLPLSRSVLDVSPILDQSSLNSKFQDSYKEIKSWDTKVPDFDVPAKKSTKKKLRGRPSKVRSARFSATRNVEPNCVGFTAADVEKAEHFVKLNADIISFKKDNNTTKCAIRDLKVQPPMETIEIYDSDTTDDESMKSLRLSEGEDEEEECDNTNILCDLINNTPSLDNSKIKCLDELVPIDDVPDKTKTTVEHFMGYENNINSQLTNLDNSRSKYCNEFVQMNDLVDDSQAIIEDSLGYESNVTDQLTNLDNSESKTLDELEGMDGVANDTTTIIEDSLDYENNISDQLTNLDLCKSKSLDELVQMDDTVDDTTTIIEDSLGYKNNVSDQLTNLEHSKSKSLDELVQMDDTVDDTTTIIEDSLGYKNNVSDQLTNLEHSKSKSLDELVQMDDTVDDTTTIIEDSLCYKNNVSDQLTNLEHSKSKSLDELVQMDDTVDDTTTIIEDSLGYKNNVSDQLTNLEHSKSKSLDELVQMDDTVDDTTTIIEDSLGYKNNVSDQLTNLDLCKSKSLDELVQMDDTADDTMGIIKNSLGYENNDTGKLTNLPDIKIKPLCELLQMDDTPDDTTATVQESLCDLSSIKYQVDCITSTSVNCDNNFIPYRTPRVHTFIDLTDETSNDSVRLVSVSLCNNAVNATSSVITISDDEEECNNVTSSDVILIETGTSSCTSTLRNSSVTNSYLTNEDVTTIYSSDEELFENSTSLPQESITDSEPTINSLCNNNHTLKAGKSWRRSLLALQRHSRVTSQSCISSCRKSRKSNIILPEPPRKVKANTNLTILENYASTIINNTQIGITDLIEEPKLQPVTAKEVVLRRCHQVDPISFSLCYPPSMLQNCFKIGEGVYGEVFLFRNSKKTGSVMKVIPIEGEQLVNGERQKTYEEILSEIVISAELSDLRNGSLNKTSTFAEVQQIRCVIGRYPLRLLELWEMYEETHGSENDSPVKFEDDQLYIVLELENCGQDMESFLFDNAVQAYSLFGQTACALAVAETALEFEHRDLHWGNILVSKTDQIETIHYKINGVEVPVTNWGIKAAVIDFTLSRITCDNVCLYNDLSLDPELFTGKGDYQFQIYRLMQNQNNNEWRHFDPYSNILWLHYILDKLIHSLRYKSIKSKRHQSMLQKLDEIKDRILKYSSATDFILKDYFSPEI